MSHLSKLIREIQNTAIDFKSPASEDLFTKFRDNIVLALAAIAGDPDNLLKGAIDADPPNASNSYITDINPTGGTISHDDKFNGLYLHFTSGTIWTANTYNRYKITDTIAGTKRVQVAENLYADGARAGDTYEITGHVHDGPEYPADKAGDFVGMRNLVNLLRGFRLTQDQIDAITDTTGVRPTAANLANPFATLGDFAAITGHDSISLTATTGTSNPVGIPHELGRTPVRIISFVLTRDAASNPNLTLHIAGWKSGGKTDTIGLQWGGSTWSFTAANTNTDTSGGIANTAATLTGTAADIRITAVDGSSVSVSNLNGSFRTYVMMIVA